MRIHQRRDEAGQATVEFALLLPLFVSCIALIVASAAIGLSSLRLADTARVVARAASTTEDPSQTVDALLKNQQISHTEFVDESRQFLTVTLRQKIRIPHIGIPIPAITMSAQSTVVIEGLPILKE